jgi:phosphoesterase RecJ-like protein
VLTARDHVAELVRRGERFLVTCHVRPDADALGSALGLAAVLRACGKQVLVYSQDPVPRNLAFLPGVQDVRRSLPADAEFDGAFVMDAAAKALVPSLGDRRIGPLVVIDHHAVHDDFGDVVLRETDACATGVIVLRLMRALGLQKIPVAAAKPLYAAIVADTGGFRYAGTTAETMRLGAELIEAGADPWETSYNLFEGWERARMKLLGLALDGMTLECGDRLAILEVSRALLDEAGADDEMVEGLVNYGRMLRGVEVAALLWEQVDSLGPYTKVSLRSSGRADVATLAAQLGGGGHRAAAAATIRVDLATARLRVLEVARATLASEARPEPAR